MVRAEGLVRAHKLSLGRGRATTPGGAEEGLLHRLHCGGPRPGGRRYRDGLPPPTAGAEALYRPGKLGREADVLAVDEAERVARRAEELIDALCFGNPSIGARQAHTPPGTANNTVGRPRRSGSDALLFGITSYGLRPTDYALRITPYGSLPTNQVSRIASHESRLTACVARFTHDTFGSERRPSPTARRPTKH